ncbi:hypothetical protein [Humisphaera borealis]|uniref:Uncharacterized protein n=1 Tax=Humisphaera borealis TaxID=2807512 RepID=A0A7M2X194_9BACT|nr:hypothetical protein [Humisphaera borealis]QOV91473.1 hypothetical protein IPV69_09000 [Humisphaera borealis]
MSATLMVSGCGNADRDKVPAPLPAPSALTRSSEFFGSPLSGPTSKTIPAPPPAEALAVQVQFVALENIPSVGVPLGSEARLITATRLGTPVLASSRLTGTARFVPLQAADRFQPDVVDASRGRATSFFAARAAVPRGVSAVFEATAKDAFQLHIAGTESSATLQIYVYRPVTVLTPDMPQPVQIAVAIEGLAATKVSADAQEAAESATKPAPGAKPAAPKPLPPPVQWAQREIAIIDREVTGKQSLAIVVPMSFDAASGKAIAVAIEIGPGDASAEHLEALSSGMEQIKQSAELAARRPTTLPFGRSESAALRAASESLSSASRLRPTLVYLAGQTGARLCEDVALVADDSVLAKLAEQGKATLDGALNAGVAGGPGDASAVGWLLDKASFELLGKLFNEGKLPPELSAVLANHAGEAGRNVASIEEVSRNLGSRQDLDNRLLAENLIYLEDSSPSARVRAFDWLRARGRAPAGFDPLGTPKERRIALEKGMAAAAAGPATAPAKP